MRKKKQKQVSKGWGIAALVTSILGLLLFLAPYVGIFLSIFAVIAAAQQDKIEKTKNAQAGRIMGIIGICINGIMLIFVIAFWGLISAAL